MRLWKNLFGKVKKSSEASLNRGTEEEIYHEVSVSQNSDYNTDRPINNVNEDLLGRAPFAQTIGKALYEYKGEESLVIGLYGKWGTGKTSVANMALQTLKELSVDEQSKPIVIRFAPWYYSDKDNLVNRFFSSLKAQIDLDSSEDFKDKVGNALQGYADVFDYVPFIPAPVAKMLKGASKVGGQVLSEKKDLDTAKNKLNTILRNEKRKIVVLIDDIDRLTNPQIRDIFQLVKQVGDLPYITYILAMDREVVRRALAGIHDTDGNEYLEKIVQIPFEMPTLSPLKLHTIFLGKLDRVIKELPDQIQWEEDYWRAVFDRCIAPYLQTLRDVNRVINTFRFRYNMLYKETSFEDMIGITTIEVVEPSLYQWIAENKENVCGGVQHTLLSMSKKGDELKQLYEKEFQSLGIDPSRSINSVATLFPSFAKDVNASFFLQNNEVNSRKQMRAAHPERFDLYFMFDMETVKVSRNTIRDFISSMNKESMKDTLKTINSEGNIIYFLEEIQSMTDSIPQNRLSYLASTLIEMQHSFEGKSHKAILSIPADYLARLCASEMVKRIETEEKRYDFYQSMLKEADRNTLGALAYEIGDLKRELGQHDDRQEGNTSPIIKPEHLKSLESTFLSKVNSFLASEDLLSFENFMSIFVLWKRIDAESIKAFLEDVLSEKMRKLKFLCQFAFRWNGTAGSGWAFNKENYSEYFSDTEEVKNISGLNKKELQCFTETELVKLASFVLNYNQSELNHINETASKALVDRWMQEKL